MKKRFKRFVLETLFKTELYNLRVRASSGNPKWGASVDPEQVSFFAGEWSGYIAALDILMGRNPR